MKQQGKYLRTLAAIVVLTGLIAFEGIALAQFKPTRPIEVVVHSGPGGGADLFARAIANCLEKENLLPQRMTVINKTGGNGAVAMAYLVGKKGESHTIGTFTTTWITTPLTTKEAQHSMKDFSLIASMVSDPMIVVVKSDSPFKSMKDIVEAAKKNPGKIKQSGGSIMSTDNLFRVLINKATGVKWDYVSFPSGGERLVNLLGGNVQLLMTNFPDVSEHIRAGNVRVISSLTQKRTAAFPNVPSIKEEGIDIPILDQTRGFLAPPGVSKEVTKYWEDLFGRLTKTQSWKKYVADEHFDESFRIGAEFSMDIDEQIKLLRPILKEAGVAVVR